MIISNAIEYSKCWNKESDQLESNDIYRKLSNITPNGNTLEFGCGVGNGTIHLAKDREVLSFDNNQYLIEQAEARLESANVDHKIHKCDFFNLGTVEKQMIKDFQPKTIVAWFIGSHGEDIFKHTEEELDPIAKSKLYREKIEDIIISRNVCTDSVEYIHLANRSGKIEGFSDEEIFNAIKDDYDIHVFKENGFEVVSVELFDWERRNSEFIYAQTYNPNLAQGKSSLAIVSIVAKRV